MKITRIELPPQTRGQYLRRKIVERLQIVAVCFGAMGVMLCTLALSL